MENHQSNNEVFDALAREGVLINVSVRYWRGCKKLRPEEIGLQSDQISNRLISLGHKRLLPKECFERLALVESRVHAYVEQSSFPFLGGLAHFLPNTKLEEVTGQLSQFDNQFQEAKRIFLSSYEEWREKALVEWNTMVNSLSLPNPEDVLAAIEAAFPGQHRLDKFFGFTTHLFQVVAPEQTGANIIGLADQKAVIEARAKAAAEAQARLRRETEIFVAECITTLRTQTAQLCHEMLESIANSDTGVHQKTLNRLVRFIDQFKHLNFAGDTEMERQLEQVRGEILSRSAEEYRNNATWKGQLVTGLTALGDRARQMAQEDKAALVQRFGELGRRKFSLAA